MLSRISFAHDLMHTFLYFMLFIFKWGILTHPIQATSLELVNNVHAHIIFFIFFMFWVIDKIIRTYIIGKIDVGSNFNISE